MIVVAGESLVDLICRETGPPTAVLGGGPYNVARTAARLGLPCAYLGALSADRFGRDLRAALRADGVDDRFAPATELPTSLALAEVDAGGVATYRFYLEGTSACALEPAAAEAVLALDPRIVYVGTLGLVLEPMASTLEGLVGRVAPDVVVAVDPNCRPSAITDEPAFRDRLDRVLARADVVKVSTEDLAFLDPGTAPVDAAAGLLERGAGVVLVTAGDGDVQVVTRGWRSSLPTPTVEVVDTVGAGDSFCGAFLAWWAERSLGRAELADRALVEAAVVFATQVAAMTCRRRGAEPPRRAELGAAGAGAGAASAL